MLVYSDLVVAYFEALASDPVTGVATGRFYQNTANHVLKFYANGGWKTVCDLETAQAVTGQKTFTSPIMTTPTLGVAGATSMSISGTAGAGFTKMVHQSSDPTAPTGSDGLIYFKNKKLYKRTVDAVTEVGGASGGSGEKNYITNPSALDDSAAAVPTGWANVGDLDVLATKTAGDLPREYTTASGHKITADSNTQSVADYVYFDFTLDDVDLSKKLKIAWAQKVTGTYTAGQLAVGITTQADRTTFLHTPVTTDIPAADGVFQTTFDSGTTATLSLVIRATSDMTTDGGIVISDVIVGPGSVVAGSVVSEWASYTPTGGWSGANVTYVGRYRRVGDTLECRVEIDATGSPTGTNLTGITLPTGLTIDATKLTSTPTGGTMPVGYGALFDSSPGDGYPLSVFYWTSTTVNLAYTDDAAAGVKTIGASASAPVTIATGDKVFITFGLPIAEWAGSGTLNVGQNDVEYSHNSTTTDADDTTAFAYGPAGSVVPTVASSAVTTARSKRVRFLNPIQAGDTFVLEIQDQGTGPWVPAGLASGYNTQNRQSGAIYGCAFATVNATDVDVKFYQGGRQAGSSATYGTAGNAFPANATDRWRLKKFSGGQAAGFGVAVTGSSGLINYYREDDTTLAAVTFAGNLGGSAGAAVAVKVTRVGRVVTVDIPVLTCTPTTASVSLNAGTALPTWARPVAGKSMVAHVKNNGAYVTTTLGLLEVSTDGILKIYRDMVSTAFTNSAVAGMYNTQFTYTI